MKRKMEDESDPLESVRNGNDQTPTNDSIIIVSGSSTNYEDELERILNRKRMKKYFLNKNSIEKYKFIGKKSYRRRERSN